MTDSEINTLTDEFFTRMRVSEEIRNDTDERNNMREYILSGERYLNLVAMGAEIDFTNDAFARDVLYNWCLYARSDSTEVFKEKWLSALLELRQLAGIRRLITKKENIENEENTEQS